MLPTERTRQLVTFCRALADDNRIRIVGLLAHKDYSVEELAAQLAISSATVSHHLQRLLAADLVAARALQYYNVYALRPDTLRAMTKQLASMDSLKETAAALDRDAYENKVIGEYFAHGRLSALPSQLKKREVVVRRLAQEFEVGKRYSERRVNEILRAFSADYDAVRRELVNARWLVRDQGYYRVTDAGEKSPE